MVKLAMELWNIGKRKVENEKHEILTARLHRVNKAIESKGRWKNNPRSILDHRRSSIETKLGHMMSN